MRFFSFEARLLRTETHVPTATGIRCGTGHVLCTHRKPTGPPRSNQPERSPWNIHREGSAFWRPGYERGDASRRSRIGSPIKTPGKLSRASPDRLLRDFFPWENLSYARPYIYIMAYAYERVESVSTKRTNASGGHVGNDPPDDENRLRYSQRRPVV